MADRETGDTEAERLARLCETRAVHAEGEAGECWTEAGETDLADGVDPREYRQQWKDAARWHEAEANDFRRIAQLLRARAGGAPEASERYRQELENIATADPSQWDPEFRDQFREWAQNRARWALGLYRAPQTETSK